MWIETIMPHYSILVSETVIILHFFVYAKKNPNLVSILTLNQTLHITSPPARSLIRDDLIVPVRDKYTPNTRLWTSSFKDTASLRITALKCMGPLLFSIFINDFLLSLKKANVLMYADDAALYSSSTAISELRGTLQVRTWMNNE